MNQVYGPFLSRKQALASGLKWYWVGKPCKNGHLAEMHVGGGCRVCRSTTALRWAAENPEKTAELIADYRSTGRFRATRRQWEQLNQNKLREQNAQKERNYRSQKTNRALGSALRCRMRAVLRGESASAGMLELLGCSLTQLRQHLEVRFQPGMTWENWGREGWHIDHILPCASFDLSQEEEQRKCFHFSNLQPLWASENIRKGAKLPDPKLRITDSVAA
jgi:hypothetical protein